VYRFEADLTEVVPVVIVPEGIRLDAYFSGQVVEGPSLERRCPHPRAATAGAPARVGARGTRAGGAPILRTSLNRLYQFTGIVGSLLIKPLARQSRVQWDQIIVSSLRNSVASSGKLSQGLPKVNLKVVALFLLKAVLQVSLCPVLLAWGYKKVTTSSGAGALETPAPFVTLSFREPSLSATR
jgi:hypothetical protein